MSFMMIPGYPDHEGGEKAEKESTANSPRRCECGDEKSGIEKGDGQRRKKRDRGEEELPDPFFGQVEPIGQKVHETERDAEK